MFMHIFVLVIEIIFFQVSNNYCSINYIYVMLSYNILLLLVFQHILSPV